MLPHDFEGGGEWPYQFGGRSPSRGSPLDTVLHGMFDSPAPPGHRPFHRSCNLGRAGRYAGWGCEGSSLTWLFEARSETFLARDQPACRGARFAIASESAEENRCSEQAGTLPPKRLDCVWLTADGGAVLLDEPLPALLLLPDLTAGSQRAQHCWTPSRILDAPRGRPACTRVLRNLARARSTDRFIVEFCDRSSSPRSMSSAGFGRFALCGLGFICQPAPTFLG